MELRAVRGLEGRYAVTADGRVWSYPKSWMGLNGRTYSHNGKWLKRSVGSHGYYVVNLAHGGKDDLRLVHRLIAEAWVANLARSPWVNHKNGVKTDPRAANLEWCTPSENHRHKFATGLQTVTEANRERARRMGLSVRKITTEQAREIVRLIRSGRTGKSLAPIFGVSQSTISNIRRGKTYAI